MTEEKLQELVNMVAEGEIREKDFTLAMLQYSVARIQKAIMPYSNVEEPFLVFSLRKMADAIEADADDDAKGIIRLLQQCVTTIAVDINVPEQEAGDVE